MKKVLTFIVVAGMVALVACGPSAEEKAAAEKAKQDSIAAVQREQAIQDSIAAAQKIIDDSLAIVKAKEDSIAAAKPAGKKK